MEFELRDYDVTRGHFDDWLASWTRGVVPLREQCGFRVIGAWCDRARDRFVWVLGYDAADGSDAADERYHALPGRIALEPEPSSFLRAAQVTRVEPIAEFS